MKTAVFGGGCFWCLEAAFQLVPGVTKVVPGYGGGETLNPTYQKVTTGKTGHAEVVMVTYDPGVASYNDLLRTFFKIHDPTQKNRQGGDVGTQYRSIILYENDQQKREALTFIDDLDAQGVYGKPAVTEVKELEVFYPAEEYHKDYFVKHPNAAYCQLVTSPKIEKISKELKGKSGA